MRSKEEIAAGRKQKQAVMDVLTPCTKNQRKYLWQVLKNQDPKNWMQDSIFFYENGIAFNTAA